MFNVKMHLRANFWKEISVSVIYFFNRLKYQRKSKWYMENRRKANQTNLKDTSEKYGKLYVFFLEVCRRFIDDKLHVGLGLPEDGKEMYEYLDQRLCSWYDEPYEDIIYGFNFLSTKEKKLLVPRDGKIKVANVDFGIYFKIISFLGGHWTYKKLGRYMVNVRNHLCHIPVASLRKEKTQHEFDGDIKQMGQDFEEAGISRDLLDECEKDIFNRVTNSKETLE